MPLNVRRFYSMLLTILFVSFTCVVAQTVPPAATSSPAAQPQGVPGVAAAIAKAPTAAEVMRERISRAKAFIAVRNYSAANYELETIRRETADPAVTSVVNVLLMNNYLEQGDYKRAQDFLNESYNIQKTTRPGAAANYFAVASQIVKGARTRVERYHRLGLNPSDRTLPLEAINDLEKLRETLELVVTHTKEISKDKSKSSGAMALLEEASVARSTVARDDYDSRKWKDEVADTREDLASSRAVVLSAVNEAPAVSAMPQNNTASIDKPTITDAAFKQPASDVDKPSDNTIAAKLDPTAGEKKAEPKTEPIKEVPSSQVPSDSEGPRIRIVGNKPVTQAPVQAPAEGPSSQAKVPLSTTETGGPIEVGSLLAYATKQSQPIYPPRARTMRTTGVVKVEVTVDENGNVASVQNASGPFLLQDAAKDAIRKWRFRPFTRDGQAVKATGFVSFNFAL